MIIGFTSSTQCVAENDAPRGSDSFSILIFVATLRESEREYRILYRLLSNATARVVSSEYLDFNYDARFGQAQTEEMDQLDPGKTIRPLITIIRNDFIPEDEECYSLQISPIDTPGLRELFSCDYSDGSINFYCVHTICIKGGDGELQNHNYGGS